VKRQRIQKPKPRPRRRDDQPEITAPWPGDPSHAGVRARSLLRDLRRELESIDRVLAGTR
jgi:hypothetical protein